MDRKDDSNWHDLIASPLLVGNAKALGLFSSDLQVSLWQCYLAHMIKKNTGLCNFHLT